MPTDDWYAQIEPEIREIVKLLRDNGFNTTSSCAHEMSVELDLGNTLSEAEELAQFLQMHGYGDFRIDASIFAESGLWVRKAALHIGLADLTGADRFDTKPATPTGREPTPVNAGARQ